METYVTTPVAPSDCVNDYPGQSHPYAADPVLDYDVRRQSAAVSIPVASTAPAIGGAVKMHIPVVSYVGFMAFDEPVPYPFVVPFHHSLVDAPILFLLLVRLITLLLHICFFLRTRAQAFVPLQVFNSEALA